MPKIARHANFCGMAEPGGPSPAFAVALAELRLLQTMRLLESLVNESLHGDDWTRALNTVKEAYAAVKRIGDGAPRREL